MTFDGRPVEALPGRTIAAVLWAAGITSWRTTRDGGRPRGVFCGIGVCFDCLVTVNGRPGRRACLVPARPGTSSAPRRARAMRTDLAVIGAGPAGLAAALAAARRGIRVALVDAAPRPGGQYFRQPAPGLGTEGAVPRHGRRTWTRLRDALAESAVDVRPEHHVWCVERESGGLTVHALLGPEQRESVDVRAHAVLLATGGYETVLPFPGWTLPGVVTAGGAQAMLKGGPVTPGRTAVVAGTGPLLLPRGHRTRGGGRPRRRARRVHGPRTAAASRPRPGRQAARGGRVRGTAAAPPGPGAHPAHRGPRPRRGPAHRRHRRRPRRGGRVRPGTERLLPCDALAVGHGMLPHTDLAETLGCRLDGHAVAVDAEQRTDVPGVWAAGEATGIGGAALALAEGHIAGRSVAARLRGTAPDPHDWAPAARIRARERTAAAALHALHGPPAHWSDGVPDDTVLCRCEEVTAGAVREALTLGAGDTRTVKLLTRAGMGWCQGRMCAPGVAALTGCPPTPSRRPFAHPVPWASWRPGTTGPPRTTAHTRAPRKDPHDRSPPLAGSPRRHRVAVAGGPDRRPRPVRRALLLARGERVRRGRAERVPGEYQVLTPRSVPGSWRRPSPPSAGSG